MKGFKNSTKTQRLSDDGKGHTRTYAETKTKDDGPWGAKSPRASNFAGKPGTELAPAGAPVKTRQIKAAMKNSQTAEGRETNRRIARQSQRVADLDAGEDPPLEYAKGGAVKASPRRGPAGAGFNSTPKFGCK